MAAIQSSRSLNAFVYLDETQGNDQYEGDIHTNPVRTFARARELACSQGGKCRGIKKLNDTNYQQQLLDHPEIPLPCGDLECRPCLRAASIAKCFACNNRTWQQAMKAGLCRTCSKKSSSGPQANNRMGSSNHAQARYNANRRIRRLLGDIRRECEVNDYQAFIGLRLGSQVHTFAFNCCVPTAHGQAIAFHCDDGTVLPQDLDVTSDKSITDAIEKVGTKEAITWHRVRQALVQWHKSFKTDRQIKDRINKAKKNLKLCQNCIFTVPNEPLESHAPLAEPLAAPVGPHDQQISAATGDPQHPQDQQYVGVIDDQDRGHHPHLHHPHLTQHHPSHHPHAPPHHHHHHHGHPHHQGISVPVSMQQHMQNIKPLGHPMPDDGPNLAKRQKLNMTTIANIHQQMNPMHMQPMHQHIPQMAMAHMPMMQSSQGHHGQQQQQHPSQAQALGQQPAGQGMPISSHQIPQFHPHPPISQGQQQPTGSQAQLPHHIQMVHTSQIGLSHHEQPKYEE